MIRISPLVFALVLSSTMPHAVHADPDTKDTTQNDTSDEASLSDSRQVGFATNKSGLTEVEVTAKKVEWEHKLPIFAQKVIDKGFDLPLPYGIAALYVDTYQELALSDLRISFGDPDQPQTPVPFVSFEPSYSDSTAWNLKLDAWLFPFMNVFLIGDHLSGDGLIPIVVPGESILKTVAPPIGGLCDKPAHFPGRPALCDEVVVIRDYPQYTGETIGVGVVLPIGWKNFFAAIPLSYTWTDTSNTTGTIVTFQGSLRMGFHFKPKRTGQIAFYGGTTYLNTEQDIFGVFEIDTDVPELGTIDINYTIHQSPSDKWNYMAGFNWVITEHWWLQAEYGFGGTREQVVASLSYRW
jgi:hypothetical protein